MDTTEKKDKKEATSDGNIGIAKMCALATCNKAQGLKVCSACNIVQYCCREHQVEHFKEGGHKFICPGRVKGEKGQEPLDFDTCSEKATSYYSQKMWLAALPYYSAMLELSQRSMGLFHPQCGKLLHVISGLYKLMGKLDKSAHCLQVVILIMEMFNDGSKETSKEMFKLTGILGETYSDMGSYKVAIELFKKAAEECIEEFGESSSERIQALSALAAAHSHDGDFDESLRVLKGALELKNNVGANTDNDSKKALSLLHYNLGSLQLEYHDKLSVRTGNEVSESIENFARAKELLVAGGYSKDHPDLQEIDSSLRKAYSKK